MHLLALFRSSWEKSLCPSFAQVFIGLFFFSWRRVSRLYLWASHPFSDVCFANIHSQLLSCLCIESMVSLTGDRKSTRLNSSHANISYAVFCLKNKKICRLTSSLVRKPSSDSLNSY